MVGSSLGFRLRPRDRCEPKRRHERQNWEPKKKSVAPRLTGRREHAENQDATLDVFPCRDCEGEKRVFNFTQASGFGRSATQLKIRKTTLGASIDRDSKFWTVFRKQEVRGSWIAALARYDRGGQPALNGDALDERLKDHFRQAER